MIDSDSPPIRQTIGFLGPAGTFSDQAARGYDPGAEYIPHVSMAQCVAALRRGEIATALLPIENSFEGAINETVDSLVRFDDLVIVDELLLPVEQHLIGTKSIALTEITEVVSHPQPLGQCRDYLERNIPQARRVVAPSTAQAVSSLSPDRPDIVAIGPALSAQIYGRLILASGIHDDPKNVTRFVAIKLAPAKSGGPTGDDRTTLVLTIPNQPGSLVRALTVLDALDINMTKIESRPLAVADRAASFGQAIFLIDIDGHQQDDTIRIALEALVKKVAALRIIGSYPRRAMPDRSIL